LFRGLITPFNYTFSIRPRYLLLFLTVTCLFANSVTIRGIVRNPAGKPVKKASVTLRNMKDEIVVDEKTNRKGNFILEDVDPNFYFLLFENEGDGSKRIKINPRKTKNKDLVLTIELNGEDQPIECYLFSNNNPTDYDPVLKAKGLNVKLTDQHFNISWTDIKQATSYVLFENDVEIYTGVETRFEKVAKPGVEYCYSVEVKGKFGLVGEKSEQYCTSAPTAIPRDISINVSKNTLSLNWASVDGAISYIIYRNDEKITNTDLTSYTDIDLEFGTDFFYKITALNLLDKESHASIEIKGTTRDFVAPPILASMKNENRIMLIWNEVKIAKTYNIYRGGDFVKFVHSNSFSDTKPPGETQCYEVTSVDQFGVESDRSNTHCSKVPIKSPTGVTADGDVASMHLNWNSVPGAIYYQVYEQVSPDSTVLIQKVKSTQLTVRDLDYGIDKCFVITALDGDGSETAPSIESCNAVLDPPHFTIQKMNIIEPSGNNALDANETGSFEFAIFNDGQSPAHQVQLSIIPIDENPHIEIGEPIILDTLLAGRIEFFEIQMKGLLKLEAGENKFELKITSQEKIILEESYQFAVDAKSVIPPKLIIADFAIANDFGTQYIPKNEQVTLTIRVQNVGEGFTEFAEVLLLENRSFTTPGFAGTITLPAMNPGDYIDFEIPIMTLQDNIFADLELTDYLDKTVTQRLELETMKHYRAPIDLTLQSIGTEDVNPYPDALGEIDVDHRIPLGRKNPNAMAIILATEQYDDSNYPDLEFAQRDGDIVRRYFNQSFGLSDFQMLPAKTWQMEGGPTANDLKNIFDPHQGDLRKRIITADKYSGVDEMDIFIYYRGYGEWVDGKPLLIPVDAKKTRHITKIPLEQMVGNLSLLSVLSNIKTITIFLDITYLNPKKSVGSIWEFQDLPDKICILSAASNGEASQIFNEKKHSIFTYSLLKGFAGSADDGDHLLELGELIEYIYKVVPTFARTVSNSNRQNPAFYGMDLKRTILDLR